MIDSCKVNQFRRNCLFILSILKIKWRTHLSLTWKACVLYSLFTASHSMSLSLKDFPRYKEGLGEMRRPEGGERTGG